MPGAQSRASAALAHRHGRRLVRRPLQPRHGLRRQGAGREAAARFRRETDDGAGPQEVGRAADDGAGVGGALPIQRSSGMNDVLSR